MLVESLAFLLRVTFREPGNFQEVSKSCVECRVVTPRPHRHAFLMMPSRTSRHAKLRRNFSSRPHSHYSYCTWTNQYQPIGEREIMMIEKSRKSQNAGKNRLKSTPFGIRSH
jgi:hypothetical protein